MKTFEEVKTGDVFTEIVPTFYPHEFKVTRIEPKHIKFVGNSKESNGFEYSLIKKEFDTRIKTGRIIFKA